MLKETGVMFSGAEACVKRKSLRNLNLHVSLTNPDIWRGREKRGKHGKAESPSQIQIKLSRCISIQSVIAKSFMFECLEALYAACTCVQRMFLSCGTLFSICTNSLAERCFWN